jgi:hypothetical protein
MRAGSAVTAEKLFTAAEQLESELKSEPEVGTPEMTLLLEKYK